MFQRQIGEYLAQNHDTATKLIDSLLNQLNWAFSEFVGMLQEVGEHTLLILVLNSWCPCKTVPKTGPSFFVIACEFAIIYYYKSK